MLQLKLFHISERYFFPWIACKIQEYSFILCYIYIKKKKEKTNWAPPVAQTVKNPPMMRETWVPSLGWEDPLEEGMATHSSALAWRVPVDREPGGLQSKWSQRVGRDWATKHTLKIICKNVHTSPFVNNC